MVEIGGKLILWHIMKIYSSHGVNDFVICLGYVGYLIKEFFANYFLHTCDITFDIAQNSMEVHQSAAEPWRVTLVDTGENTLTGGRLKRALPYVGNEDFCFTYGDGVADVDITGLIAFHREQGRQATVTAVQPPGRFGSMDMQEHRIRGFQEKPEGDGSWTNDGFFVLSPEVGRLLPEDATIWEREPVEALAAEGELAAWPYRGFWHAMDTLRDKVKLEELWADGAAPGGRGDRPPSGAGAERWALVTLTGRPRASA